MGKGFSPAEDAATASNIPQQGYGQASTPSQPNQQSPGQPASQVHAMPSLSGQHSLNAQTIFPPGVLAGNNPFLPNLQGCPGQGSNTGLPNATHDPFAPANIFGLGSMPHQVNPHFADFLGAGSQGMAVSGMAPNVGVNEQQPPNPGALAGLQQYFGGLGTYGAFNQNAFAQAQSLGHFNLNMPPTPGVPPMGGASWPTFGGALAAEAGPTAAASGHSASFMHSILSHAGPDAAGPLSSAQLAVSGNGVGALGTTAPLSAATPTDALTGSSSTSEGSSAAQFRVQTGQLLPAPQLGQWAIPMPNAASGHAQPGNWHVSMPAGIPNPGQQPHMLAPAPFLPGVGQTQQLPPAGLPALHRMPSPGNISSLASLLGGFLPTMSTPQATIAQPATVWTDAPASHGALPSAGYSSEAREQREGVGSKRTRFAPPAHPLTTTSDGPASSDKDDDKDTAVDRHESVVEKRLKQNREAARRSRERKRQLKEELRRRMPVLQKQHDDMAVEVDELMKSMWSNVFKLLSKEMQDLMLQQSIYIDQCAALATHLESADDKALSTALDSVDACWAQLLSAVECVKHGLGFFMLFTSMHAQPSHWMWYLLGGVKLSLVLRTFLELSGQVQVMSNETAASLARSVEGWSFHEAILDQGKVLLRTKLREACITMARQQRELGHCGIPPPLLGHLDMLSVLLAKDLSLRKQIMATLRKTLSPRQMCLLLVVQTALLESHSAAPP